MKLREIKRVLLMLGIFLVLLAVIYPAVVTLVGRVAFPGKEAGSLIQKHGRVVGSSLIGQQFTSPGYFWPRPSAAASTLLGGSMPYDPLASGGSNLGPTNPKLVSPDPAVGEVSGAVRALRNSGVSGPLPIDLVTSSGSGLDPDITVEAARAQAARVAAARHMPLATVEQLIDAHTDSRWLGFIGTRRVNVLELNLALDAS
ncbi:MAG: potassium-transporting ATPase subunit KdpC [Actinobacteria bacterium]|nr:potassium-transporting ATPase subunit KdpC [Actinomycetota bacterium]